MTHLLERHHHCQRVNQEQRSNQKPLLRIARTTRSSRVFSYHSRYSYACNGCGRGWTRNWCDQSLDSPFDPCERQSEPPPVSLQEQQVTSSDSLRGQSAMPHVSVPAQQIDSDDEGNGVFCCRIFVIDQEHDERIWATLDEGCNAACHSARLAARAERYFDMFGFQSEYREGTRNKVFTGLGGNTVAAVGRRKLPFALAFTAERGDIHHLSGTTESWELLVMDLSCS